MKRRLITLGIAVVGVCAVLSLIQRFQLQGRYREVYKEFASERGEQRNMNMSLHLVDQYGKPAEGLTFRAELWSIRWYYWLFPFWCESRMQKVVTSGGDGTAWIGFEWRKGYILRFEEVDTSRYRFAPDAPQGINPHGYRAQSLSAKGTPFELRVIRHGPILPDLPRYCASLRKAFPLIEPARGQEDDVDLPLLLNPLRIARAEDTPDLVLQLKRPWQAYKMAVKLEREKGTRSEGPAFEVIVKVRPGIGIRLCDDSLIAYAPEENFGKSVLFVPGPWTSVVEPLITGQVYLRSDLPRIYSWLDIRASIRKFTLPEIQVDLRSYQNPDGSTNLYHVQ